MRRLLVVIMILAQMAVTGSAVASLLTIDFGAGGVDLSSVPFKLIDTVTFSFLQSTGGDTAVTTAKNAPVNPNGIVGTNDLRGEGGQLVFNFATTNTGHVDNLIFNYTMSGVNNDLSAFIVDFYTGGSTGNLVFKKIMEGTPDPFTGILSLESLYKKAVFDTVLITMSHNAATYAFTNIQYEAVPEPSTYALLVIGLGMVGYARKRMTSKEV